MSKKPDKRNALRIPGIQYDHAALEVQPEQMDLAVEIMKIFGFKEGSREQGVWGEAVKMVRKSDCVQLHISYHFPDNRTFNDNHIAFKVNSLKTARETLKKWTKKNEQPFRDDEEDGSCLFFIPNVLCFFIELTPKKNVT